MEIIEQGEVSSLCCTLCLSGVSIWTLLPKGQYTPGFLFAWVPQAWVMAWVPFPSPGDLLDPGVEPTSPSLPAYS